MSIGVYYHWSEVVDRNERKNLAGFFAGFVGMPNTSSMQIAFVPIPQFAIFAQF